MAFCLHLPIYITNGNLPSHKKARLRGVPFINQFNYLKLSSIATATATVIPTIGLLPAPMRLLSSMYVKYVNKL